MVVGVKFLLKCTVASKKTSQHDIDIIKSNWFEYCVVSQTHLHFYSNWDLKRLCHAEHISYIVLSTKARPGSDTSDSL